MDVRNPARSASGLPLGCDGMWLDIGRPEDYAVANETVQKHRERFLPDAGGPGGRP